MIRPEAAQKLAQDILEPFIRAGVAGADNVELVAKLIRQDVQLDEMRQQLESLEAA